ncbi:unnamed protein product [Lymnaea stagnalis]|uniref:ABCA1-4-like C-terminal R2 regulatory domain-containing protein n=1 Tax=Lymnaea stagnalis TaxID=6523 RepID=A0AAV2IJ57_LYMST
MRRERTILLTTHYMDEADVMGDRIMIMAEGVVKCAGTPMFLKQIYGTGYQMNVVISEKCNSQSLTSLIRKFIPEAKRKGETSNEIYYLLPDEQMHLLPKLFAELEENMETLHISSFGITATSMEDVFIR